MSALDLPADGDDVALYPAIAVQLDSVLSRTIATLMNVKSLITLGPDAARHLTDAESARTELRRLAEPVRFTGPGYSAHPGRDHVDCCK